MTLSPAGSVRLRHSNASASQENKQKKRACGRGQCLSKSLWTCGVNMRCQQKFNQRQMGETFFFYVDPVKRPPSLGGVFGGEGIDLWLGHLLQELSWNCQKLSGRGFGFRKPFSIITRHGGLIEDFRLCSAKLCCCLLTDFAQVHANNQDSRLAVHDILGYWRGWRRAQHPSCLPQNWG